MAFRYNRYERQAYYTTQAALDAAVPNGTYTIQINTRNEGTFLCNLTLTGNAYPNAPRFTNYTAAQVIDATQPFTLAWDAFTGGTTNDFILLLISSAPNETPTNYFASPLPGQPGAVTGDESHAAHSGQHAAIREAAVCQTLISEGDEYQSDVLSRRHRLRGLWRRRPSCRCKRCRVWACPRSSNAPCRDRGGGFGDHFLGGGHRRESHVSVEEEREQPAGSDE